MKFHFRSQLENASTLLSRTVLGMLLLCGSASAASSFHVRVDTAALILNPGAPFSLDFQFNDGGVLGNNQAIVSHFSYSGGGAVGSPSPFGGALGDINSSIVFDNSTPFQELFQTFTPGASLSFDVLLTSNVDGATPDAFVFGILDKDLFNIPTNGLGDSLVLVNLESASSGMQSFSGTGDFAGVSVFVPEPESYVLMLAALPLLALAAFAQRNKFPGW